MRRRNSDEFSERSADSEIESYTADVGDRFVTLSRASEQGERRPRLVVPDDSVLDGVVGLHTVSHGSSAKRRVDLINSVKPKDESRLTGRPADRVSCSSLVNHRTPVNTLQYFLPSTEYAEPSANMRSTMASHTQGSFVEPSMVKPRHTRSHVLSAGMETGHKTGMYAMAAPTRGSSPSRRHTSITTPISGNRVEGSTNVTVNDSTPRKALPTIKLGMYRSDTPLETFLCKLDNCMDYYQ